jgi:hypothetical protein
LNDLNDFIQPVMISIRRAFPGLSWRALGSEQEARVALAARRLGHAIRKVSQLANAVRSSFATTVEKDK